MARAEACLHAKIHLDPSNRLAVVYERLKQDRHARQRPDSKRRTVLQTVDQNRWEIAYAYYKTTNCKCLAVDELGDRVATIDMGRKLGLCAPFLGSWIPI